MITSLKGGTLWAVVVVVLAVIGSATALVYNGTLSGDLWVAIVSSVLAGTIGVTVAHVSGNQVMAAATTSASGTSTVAPSAPGPTPTPAATVTQIPPPAAAVT